MWLLTLSNPRRKKEDLMRPEYSAPEALLEAKHMEVAGWWTLGVFLYQMLTVKPSFSNNLPGNMV